jgi:hypothetical protein
MAVDLKVTWRKNTFQAPEPLTVGSGDRIELAAFDHDAVPAAPAVGKWTFRPTQGAVKDLPPDAAILPIAASDDTAGNYTFTSEALGAASVTLVVESRDLRGWIRRLPWGALGVIAVFIVYSVVWAAATGAAGWGSDGHTGKRAATYSTLLAVFTLAAFLVLVEIAGRVSTGDSGLASLVAGKDRRASNSKIQVLLWTLLLGGIFAFIAAYSAMVPGHEFQCPSDPGTFCVPHDPDNWAPFLVLLGVPAAAAVTAKGLVSYKVSNGTLQKSEADQTKSAQVVSNDNGQTDIVDVQYLLFNLVAFSFVFGAFLFEHELKPVPDLLLGLTSTAAATYVLNKALVTNKPRITAVVPSVVKPGDRVYVTGENLLVADADGKPPQSLEAKVAGIRAAAVPEPGTTAGSVTQRLMVDVPVGLTGAEAAPTITVITAANVEAEGFPITVSVAPLAIVGWVGAPPNVGQAVANAVIVATGLPKAPGLSEADKKVQVTFNGQALPGTLDNDGNVVIGNIPAGITTTSPTAVKLTYLGKASEPVSLPVVV